MPSQDSIPEAVDVDQDFGPDIRMSASENEAGSGSKDLSVSVRSKSTPTKGSHYLSSLEFNLSLLVLGSMILTLLVLAFLVSRSKRKEEGIKFLIITVIVFGGLFLITAGYSSEQLAPAFGLLGTIAGYLLGRSSAAAPPGAGKD